MPIPSSGNIALHADIHNEFAPLTRPDPWSQEEALDAIFGSGRTEDSIRDFAGLSRPTNLDTEAATNVDAESATLNAATIGDGGLGTGWWYFEYDDNSSFTSPSYTSTTQFNGSASNPSQNISGLNAETTYYYRIVAYNGFNADNGTTGSSDHDRGDTVSFETGLACPIPTGIFVTADFEGFDIAWNSMSGANSYDLECSVNSGSFFTVATGITATSYNHEGCGSAFNNGDMVRYRLRSNCSGGSSPFSDPTTAEEASCV